jgi:hypothetical protein
LIYLIEYVDKMLKLRSRCCLRHHHGKIAAKGIRGSAVLSGREKPSKQGARAASAALSPDRQTRYELKSSFGRAAP